MAAKYSFGFFAIIHVRRDYRQDGCRSPRLARQSVDFTLVNVVSDDRGRRDRL